MSRLVCKGISQRQVSIGRYVQLCKSFAIDSLACTTTCWCKVIPEEREVSLTTVVGVKDFRKNYTSERGKTPCS